MSDGGGLEGGVARASGCGDCGCGVCFGGGGASVGRGWWW